MKLIVILFLLMSYLAFGQGLKWSDTKEQLKSEELTLKQLEKLLYKDKKDYDVDSELFDYRHIHKKYIQKYVLFSIYDKGNSYYFLNTVISKNKIIYFDLKHVDSSFSEVKYQKTEYTDLIKLHDEKYNIKSDANHYYFNKVNKSVLGFACYYSGSHAQEFDDLQLLLDSNNIDEIRKWSHSLTPEIRCVGGIGLFCYQQKGNVLSESDLNVMNQIAEEKTKIYGCIGCTELGLISTIAEIYQRGCEYLVEK